MKKLFLLLAASFLSIQFSFADKVPADSIPATDTAHIVNAKIVKDSVITTTSVTKDECDCMPADTSHWKVQWWLIFTPILLFVIVFAAFLLRLKSFNFKDALTENEMPKYTILNPKYESDIKDMLNSVASATNDKNIINLNDIVPPTLDVTILPIMPPATPPEAGNLSPLPNNNYRPSISRYIAFFSGLLTIIIAVCMASFFMYHYMSTGCPPDLSALSTVLIALGIGVAPYAVNKISAAIANKKDD